MSDDVINGQSVYLTDNDLQIFIEVDEILKQAVTIGDPRIATQFGYQLYKGSRLQGVALAKLLHGLQDRWDIFEVSGIQDDFYSVMLSEIGTAESTTRRYVNMWDSIFMNPNISDDAKKELLGKPMKTLLLLPGLAHDEIEGKVSVDWSRVANMEGQTEVREYVRDIRGIATSSSTAVYTQLEVRTGRMIARRDGEEPVVFGLLNMDKMVDEKVKIAIERIIRGIGMQEI
jgi:hypothetical protein